MPLRPLGTGTSTSWVVPDLTVYVFETAEPPSLPADVVERTRDRYLEAYERITGESLF